MRLTQCASSLKHCRCVRCQAARQASFAEEVQKAAVEEARRMAGDAMTKERRERKMREASERRERKSRELADRKKRERVRPQGKAGSCLVSEARAFPL